MVNYLHAAGYLLLYVHQILQLWIYRLFIRFAHRFLYRFFQPATKAYIDHEYKLVTHFQKTTLIARLRQALNIVLTPATVTADSFGPWRIRIQLTDTPSAAFLRIVHLVRALPKDWHRLNVPLGDEVQDFWRRGINDCSRPDHFVFGGQWRIADLPPPMDVLGHDPLLCAIAASTAEQMVEAFNWRIGLGIRRDMMMLRARRPYWDKKLAKPELERAPAWCAAVGPAPEQTVVDCQDETARSMLELESSIPLSPNFKKRNLLASSQFMFFA